jgi:hypothetical protein
MMDIIIAILTVIGHQAGVIINSISIMFIAWWLGKTDQRITNLQHSLQMKEWVEALSNGEHPSDLAREMGRPFTV